MFLLKSFALLLGLGILGIGFLFFRARVAPGYQKGLFGVKYFYKNSHESYFYKARKLKGEDKASFEDLGANFAKDKKQVYYKGFTIPEAEPASFEYGLFGNNHF
ncbi:MAG: DKNYY domain-containing protein, partial [Bacteroidota bacterium]